MFYSRSASLLNSQAATVAPARVTMLITTALLLTAAGSALADDRMNEAWVSETASRVASFQFDENADRNFRLRFRGGVWLAAPTGDVTFGSGSGGGGNQISVEDNLDLNDPEVSFTGDITIDFTDGQFKNWQLWFDVFDTSQDATTNLSRSATVNGTSLPKGTLVSSSLSATSFGAHVGYDLFGNLLDVDDDDPTAADLRIHVLGGLRLLDFEQSLRASGLSANYDDSHLIGELGGRLSILVEPAESKWGAIDVSVNLLSGYGFSDGNLSTVDLFTAITWYPVHYAGVTAGYRLFGINLDDVKQSNGSNFEWNAYFAGFFVGGQIRF